MLLEIIKSSSAFNNVDNILDVISSNCVSIYNIMGFSFSGLNLNNCCLKGSIINKGILHNTDISDADL